MAGRVCTTTEPHIAGILLFPPHADKGGCPHAYRYRSLWVPRFTPLLDLLNPRRGHLHDLNPRWQHSIDTGLEAVHPQFVAEL